MPARFLSQDWLDQGRQALEADPEFVQRTQGVTATLLTQVHDAPGGQTVCTLHVFEDGRLVRMESGPADRFEDTSPTYRLTGSYATFADLHRGAITVQGAYLRRKVRLHGDTAAFLRFAPALMRYNQVLKSVETEY